MRLSYVVVGGQRSVPVVVVRAGILVRLFARRVELVPLAQPVVLVACCVYIDGGVAVVVGCHSTTFSPSTSRLRLLYSSEGISE